MTRWRVYAAFAGLFGMGMLTGRTMVPPKVVSVDRLVEVQREAKAQVAVATAQKEAAEKTRDRWRTVTVYQPGGTITVTKTVVKEVERAEHEATSTVTAAVEAHEAIRAETHERTVEAPKTRWSVAARAGMGLDGKLRYQGDVGRRLFGGLWVTVGADVAQRVALIGLRMDF